MFPYSDPTADDLLKQRDALSRYRASLHDEYVGCARVRGSAFTKLEAFDGVSSTVAEEVSWPAFPKSHTGTAEERIDAERALQDEYVEWITSRDGNGLLKRVEFVTEFPDYFAALAAAGVDALHAGIQAVYPSARPTVAECFGESFSAEQETADGRTELFLKHAARNPWANGRSGALFLVQKNNTLHALFELVKDCAIPNAGIPSSAICGQTDCVSTRNSDPAVCQAIQELARARRSVSLADPVGVTIGNLGGIWTLAGKQIDINDQLSNSGTWRVSRGGRRAVLSSSPDLRLAGKPIVSGAQVARVLSVGVAVVSAPDVELPFWARRGNESSRRIV